MPTPTNIAQGAWPLAVTVPNSQYRMLVYIHVGHAVVAGADPRLATLVLDPGGMDIPFSLWKRQVRTVGGKDMVAAIWYLIDPPVGSYDISGAWTAGNCSVKGWAYTCVDVNTANPFLDAGLGATNNDAAPTVSPSSMPTNLVIDAVNAWGFPNFTVGPGQTVIGAGQAMTACSGWCSYEAGASPTVTMSWTLSFASDWVICAVSINHKLDDAGRIVAYQTDIWDPKRLILDQSGAILDPWDVKPDNYCVYLGRELPSAVVHENLNDNPAVEYIEEVECGTGMERPAMKGNRSQLPDIMLVQAAGGRSV